MKILDMILKKFILLLFLTITISLQSCNQTQESNNMTQPVATKIPYSFTMHGQTINDEYAWLRDKNWPKVTDKKILDYLHAENDYYDRFFKPLKLEQNKLFEELKGRIQLTDQSVYTKKDNYYYYTRTEEVKDYPIYCRKKDSTEAKEEIILDVNKLAEGKKFTRVGAVALSPDHNLMAYSVDFTGDEKYSIKIFDLSKQEYLPDIIDGVGGNIVWHQEMPGFFYTPINEQMRQQKIMFHVLGSDNETDKLIFDETDNLYQVGVSKSSSREYIFISSGGHDNNGLYVIPMSDKSMQPKLVRAKEEKTYYDIDHNGDYFYIRTNKGAENFRVVRLPVTDFARGELPDYILEDKQRYLTSFDLSKNYLILNYSDNGLPLIKIRDIASSEEKTLNFPDQAFEAGASCANFFENDVRVGYSSLARPATTYSYDFKTNGLSILKVQNIPSGFNPDEYMVERLFVKNRLIAKLAPEEQVLGTLDAENRSVHKVREDLSTGVTTQLPSGVEFSSKSNEDVLVPVTVFYKKSLFKKDGSNPLYLYGYGSYGIAVPTSFRSTAVSIADRGIVFAIAHIRGGDELGQQWYEAAKFLNKKRTFEDFIKSCQYLIDQKYTSKGNIVIAGGSAGGLLVGYAANEHPELFKGVIAHVPFVDILNTMLDESLPLTPGEFKEWGNPKEPEYFSYIRSYSPYDNIKAQNYPAMLVSAGLSDPRVGYWEAAKWVARLRATKTDHNQIILKTNMDYGHQGASGRFEYLKEVADDLVFIFQLFGKNTD